MSSTVILEWDGVEYELKYTFSMVRRLKNEGINIAAIFRATQLDPMSAGDYGDEYAYIAAWLLREAGCPVSDEDVWRAALADESIMREISRLFIWVVTQHFAHSKEVPPPPKKKAAARKKKAAAKKTSR